MKTPWMKFYPTDWRSDPNLRSCSIEARGLWIDMLCLMHEGEPYGHLSINNIPVTKSTLSRVVGLHHHTVGKLLVELELQGVYSRSSSGCIYSRKMVRDFEKFLLDQSNGSKGGNPSLNPPINGVDKAQILDTRSQKLEEERKTPSGAATEYAYENGVIRLIRRDLERWQKTFPEINVCSQLETLGEWAAKQKNWFQAVSGALNKKNSEAMDRKKAIQIGIEAGVKKVKTGGGFA